MKEFCEICRGTGAVHCTLCQETGGCNPDACTGYMPCEECGGFDAQWAADQAMDRQKEGDT